ncbi:MAG: two-component sensor histidine kinase [Anaerocolumna sp.]|jgi:RNA polymerase sigma factor (sigma-70 family)|nr:two-component sensor histidine kinase [Anaerocolumna sp.]
MIEIYKKNEAETNEVVSKSILYFFEFIFIMGIFCWTGIFNINNDLVNGFVLASMVPLILPIILVNLMHMNKYWIKYLLITCVIVVTGISYIVFTFQTIMIFIVPTIIATFYLEKKVMYYTGIVSIFNILIAHLISSIHLFQPWIEPFHGWKAIMLYGALPRIMQYLFTAILLYMLCKRFMNFFHGLYEVILDEKKTHTSESNKKELNELNNILEQLTEREKEVFELLVQGNTNIQIASRLCLSNGTVKNYVSVIYDKIGMKDRTAIVIKYSTFYRGND